jgi:hypothetical protein
VAGVKNLQEGKPLRGLGIASSLMAIDHPSGVVGSVERRLPSPFELCGPEFSSDPVANKVFTKLKNRLERSFQQLYVPSMPEYTSTRYWLLSMAGTWTSRFVIQSPRR